MIPTIYECLEIMDKYGMLENIKNHSIMVAKVAYVITNALIRPSNDIKINPRLIIAGALLHDIGKTESLKTGVDHTQIGIDICIKNGLYEVAEIVAEHVILKEFNERTPISEKEIIYYSDKRVNHDKVVSLEERLSYIIERYSKGNKKMAEAIKENFSLCKEVEKKIFKELPFKPQDIPLLADQVSLSNMSAMSGR